MDKPDDLHRSNIRIFAIVLLCLEVMMIVLYSVFVRFRVAANTNINAASYPAYQDVNVMMLIGFGFLMSFVKRYSLSALSYTFFINAIVVQAYILLSAFWSRVFEIGFEGNFTIYVDEKSFTAASYSVASVLIAFGGVLGRVGPLDLLLMGLVQVIGYTFNEALVYQVIQVFDVGGSMAIHSFGAYFGLTVSLMLSRAVMPEMKPQANYSSHIFSLIGTLFLWMYWPSFNCAYFPTTDYQKTQIVTNTILSLTASCLSTFMMSAFLKNRFLMEDIINATLAGGVIIGAPAGLLYHPGGSLAIGFMVGIISTVCFHYLSDILEHKIGLHDTCGIHNLHGIPGVLGGILSAIIISSYNISGSVDPIVTTSTYMSFYSQTTNGFLNQGGLQIAGTVASVGFGIIFGVFGGLLMRLVYHFTPSEFNRDDIYFETDEEYAVLKGVNQVAAFEMTQSMIGGKIGVKPKVFNEVTQAPL